ncbi:MAG TPA: hypothetical protein VHB73_01555 [Alphaproteobacteria bacterium]|nr:hypothetical protein [Alphaproteobacteria bacterium]
MGLVAGKITRNEFWTTQLSRFLKERAAMPFEWGVNDCLLFAADAVLAITGVDLAEDVRGGYDSEETADTLLSQYGGMEAAVTAAIGMEPHYNPLLAKRGDVALVEVLGNPALAIVDDSGARLAVARSRDGIQRLPLTAAKKIWSY